jgi:uncharacterized protein involved in response to NO
MPPSFVFLPAGLLAGAAGAVLLLGFASSGAAWMLAPGRSLAGEGLFEALVLALAPMLASPILHDGALPDRPARPARPGGRAWWIAAAAAFLASFVLQHGGSERVGLALRGALSAVVLLRAAPPWRPPTVPGLHRRLFPVALALFPLGLLGAAALPALRLGCLHLTFIGGLSLLVFSVSFHVVMLHTGRPHLAAGRPWPVLVVAVLTLAAAAVRVGAEQWGARYFAALALASSLWLVATGVWGGWLLRLLLRPPEARAA